MKIINPHITLLHAKQMIDNHLFGAAKNIFGNKYQPKFDYIEAGTSNYKSQFEDKVVHTFKPQELTPKQKLMRSGEYFTERRKDNE